MIRQVCACGKSYQLKDDMVGRKVKCPACQAVFTVIPQAELVPLDGPPGAAQVGACGPSPPVFQPPQGPANPYGNLQPLSPGMSPLSAPFGAPLPSGGFPPATPAAAATTPRVSRGFPVWFWVAAAISGVAAIGSMVLVVLVVVRMNRPDSGNRAMRAPSSIPPLGPGGLGGLGGSDLPLVGPYAPGGQIVGTQIGQWQNYSSDTGGYSISLPGKPQVFPEEVETPLGAIEGQAVVVGGETAGMVAIVTHTDLPFDTARFSLDRLIESSVSPQLGKISHASDVQISGRPGREFLVEFSFPGVARSKGLYRVLGIGGRVYSLAYVSPWERFDDAAAHKCLESFAITKEPPSKESTYAPLVAGAGVPLQREVAWVTHESQKGGYRIDMPATPTNVSANIGIPRNRYAEGIAAEVADKGAFVVSANAHGQALAPEQLPSFLESLRLTVGSKGKVVSESSAMQGTYSVIDYAVDAPNSAKQLVRYYVSPEWFYSVTWFGPSNQAASEEVSRFFNSFRLLSAGQPAAAPAASP